MGARKGDVMAILMPNNVEYPLAMCGASAVGVISTTINPTYTAGEIARQLEFSEVRLVRSLNQISKQINQVESILVTSYVN